MSRLLHDYEHQSWDRDIASYQRAAERLAAASSDHMRDFCEAELARVRAKYPQHFRTATQQHQGMNDE